jgi:phage terminase Nu1 subunit (DNA packaging protein)
MLVNKKQLAEVFGVSERSFSEYQKDPTFPIKEEGGRGRSNTYDTAQVFEWLKSRAEGQGKETAKERLDRLRGDQAELAIAKEIGELVPAEDVARELDDVVSAIRSSQMFGNTKLKKELDTVYSLDIDIEILNDHSREILTDLSVLEVESAECDQDLTESV